MTSPLFSPRAGRDAAAWIAEDNTEAAERFVHTVVEAARRLQNRPMLARRRAGLAPERYRFWSLRGFPYSIVVDVETDP